MPRVDVRSLGVVAAGGTAGALARHAVVTAVGVHGAVATLAVNVTGAFALGLLLDALHHHRIGSRRRGRLRLLLGTGLLGGFTTYSGIAVEVLARVHEGAWGSAVGYGLVTVVAGLAACAAGVLLGRRVRAWA